MSKIRTDPLTGFMTIFAPERSNRPIMISNDTESYKTKEQIESDPFAEGKESETTPESYAIRQPESEPNQPGWTLRTIANKFPVLKQQVDLSVDESEHGIHEVIVECPHYETQLTRLDQSYFQNMFRAYRQRIMTHRSDPKLDYAVIFKNQGILGGASLGHVHSQFLASPIVPPAVQQEVQRCQQYLSENGSALFESFVRESPTGYTGLVTSSSHFNVICPYASRFAYETWITPCNLNTHFDHSTDSELDDLAILTQRLLLALEEILGNHDYNYAIQTAPFSTNEESGYTWSMRIYPRLAYLAGFELATNMYINSVFPEQAVAHLKKQLET